MSEWVVYARDAGLSRAAQVDDYQRLELHTRFNDVGSWLLDMDSRAGGAANLLLDGAGLEVTRDGATVLSGPVRMRGKQRGGEKTRLLVAGVDDATWLARRLAHPQPATAAPPYTTQAHDVRTGQCSAILRQYVDVNAGPGALSVRAVPGLTLAADPALGATVTGRARWQPLLELLQEKALEGGNLGFRLRQSGASIQFSVYQPVDRTATVILSEDLGSLREADWSEEAAAANYVFAGGGGEGTTRTIQEGQDSASIVRWGRIEMFRDRRDTTVTTELDAAIQDELKQSAGPVALSVTAIDLPQLSYGRDYDLGDKVTVIVDGQPVRELIREVAIKLTPEDGAVVTPCIGTPGRVELLSLFDRMRRMESRLVNLERR